MVNALDKMRAENESIMRYINDCSQKLEALGKILSSLPLDEDQRAETTPNRRCIKILGEIIQDYADLIICESEPPVKPETEEDIRKGILEGRICASPDNIERVLKV